MGPIRNAGLCLFCLILFGSFSPLQATEKILEHSIVLPTGQTALVVLPKGFRLVNRYPAIIALHGLNQDEQFSCDTWRPVATQLNFIVLCPRASSKEKGYLHGEIDDRKHVLQFWKQLGRRYRIDYNRSVLVGFSRGGNFAIELGLFYPRYFPRVVSYFGFFNGYSQQILKQNAGLPKYASSQFYFVTGTKDLTLQSNKNGVTLLRETNIRASLEEYPDLIHAYPKDLLEQFQRVMARMQ
ncbi:MAG: alpha/beta hydrolase-fold protein [bacterium]|nr:alpha/beta hydrolase-fold protein [bacterium]